MENLSKTFYERQTLTAAELNLIISKINEIIENIPSSSTQNPGITETEVNNKINAAKDELQLKINQILSQIENFDDGNTHIRTDEELLDLFKSAGKEVLIHYGVCDSEGHPYFNVLVDENGVKPAAIIGSITDNNGKLISSIGISADQITIDGNTTLTGKLTALDADIANINVPDTATIKNAVISDIEAGNVTITGTLHYNKIVGNVQQVSQSTYLDGNSYFVQFTGSFSADSSNWPTIFLPSASDGIETGQTIFLDCGTRCFVLGTTGPSVQVYYIGTSSTDDPEIQTTTLTVPNNNGIKVLDAGWNGVVQFLYNGSIWVQLIHNITVHQ